MNKPRSSQRQGPRQSEEHGPTIHKAASSDIEWQEQEQASRGKEKERTRRVPLTRRRLKAHDSPSEDCWQAQIRFMEDSGEINLGALELTQQCTPTVGGISAGLDSKSWREVVDSEKEEERQDSRKEEYRPLQQQNVSCLCQADRSQGH